jgi:hypothetical protein
VFSPEKFCTRVVQDSRTYAVAVLVDTKGAATHPTAEQAKQFAARIARDSQDAACVATKASGFPPGTYTGETTQRLTLRDGTKIFAWKSLSVTIDESGCLSWRGLSFSDDFMPGDELRNIDDMASTCINEGDGTITAARSGFKLAATIRSKASGGMPTRFHLWKCPGIGNVQTDMSMDLSNRGCIQIGNAADPSGQRGAEIACQMSEDFNELKGRPLTIQKDGSVRMPLTIADPGILILRRVDKRE